jgi:hypothetical protein
MALSLAGRTHGAAVSCPLSGYPIRYISERRTAQKPVLRSRAERPYNYGAAEKPDEFPPLHGIYSLAENHLRESLIRSSSAYAPHRSRTRELMSALGQKQTSGHLRAMSALPPKADIG